MKSIKLKSKDGDIRTIDTEVAKMSITLKDMIESSEDQSDDNSSAVPLEMSTIVLDKVIEYMKYHFDDPIDDKDSDDEESNYIKRTDDICEWDMRFIDVEREVLFDVILAANFLDIKGLLEIGCKTAANQIKGKTAEEVRKLWDIECDLTPEEDERLRRENAWTE